MAKKVYHIVIDDQAPSGYAGVSISHDEGTLPDGLSESDARLMAANYLLESVFLNHSHTTPPCTCNFCTTRRIASSAAIAAINAVFTEDGRAFMTISAEAPAAGGDGDDQTATKAQH